MELVAEHGAAVVALTIDEEARLAPPAEGGDRRRLIADITGNWG
jgi:5-methyltetrahydrofolate--homocysteine methyltransferase